MLQHRTTAFLKQQYQLHKIGVDFVMEIENLWINEGKMSQVWTNAN